jgi:hypothetical protein
VGVSQSARVKSARQEQIMIVCKHNQVRIDVDKPAASSPERFEYCRAERILGTIELLIVVAFVVAAVSYPTLLMLPVAVVVAFALIVLALCDDKLHRSH